VLYERYENPYRLLVKEFMLVQACKPELNRTTHSVSLIVFSDGFTTDMLSDLNDQINIIRFLLSVYRLTAFICLEIISS
jgi:hypothetical protein